MMSKGGSRAIRQFSQYTAPGQNSYRSANAPIQPWGFDAGFSLDGPYEQPSAKVGNGNQSPWLEAEDEVITCIPIPFGLEYLGGDSSHDRTSWSDTSNADSNGGGQMEPRYTPPAVQQPTMQSFNQEMAPRPFHPLVGEGHPGPDMCVGNSKHEAGRGGGYPGTDMYFANNRQESESGLYGRTTIMIRRAPQNLTHRKLVWELNTAGFANLYDYIYIPLDRGLLARPMVFVNFTTGDAAEKFYQIFNGRPLRSSCFAEPVFVIPASIQGLAHNLTHHFECIKKVELRRKHEADHCRWSKRGAEGRRKHETGRLLFHI
mmetsp:Transcript_14120/g.40146  ORF Transcript_14120/g.40146 Transcript_14120/m.40146 type:complete len:317 (+) Transcript_14120:90-1040(+)